MTDVASLLRAVETLSADRETCQITIVNDTPKAWAVTIVAAGVKFFYDDGSDYTDGPKNINLAAGGTATFVANSSDKCVKSFYAVMTVYSPKGGAQTFEFTSENAEAGECWIHASVVLGPKKFVSRSVIKEMQLKSLLEISLV